SVALFLLRDFLPLKHLQHAIGDDEAADYVRRGTNYSDETENRADGVVLRTRGDDRADERYAGDRVSRRHQRRVQQRRHSRNHLVTKKRREREHIKRRNQKYFLYYWIVYWHSLAPNRVGPVTRPRRAGLRLRRYA